MVDELEKRYTDIKSEEVVSYVGEFENHYEVSGTVIVKFKDKIVEIDFGKAVPK